MSNIGGNYYNKYQSNNPIAQYLMNGFFKSFDELTQCQLDSDVFEVGCGEGYLSRRLASKGCNVTAIDVEEDIISQAQENPLSGELGIVFYESSIYDLHKNQLREYDLVVCCEVLEHLETPEEGLKALLNSGARSLVLSVPREPIWRIMNMARLRYLKALGNTPGHINHWSFKEFCHLVERYFIIERTALPLPWIFLKVRPH